MIMYFVIFESGDCNEKCRPEVDQIYLCLKGLVWSLLIIDSVVIEKGMTVHDLCKFQYTIQTKPFDRNKLVCSPPLSL